jgi:hypothetical protein
MSGVQKRAQMSVCEKGNLIEGIEAKCTMEMALVSFPL